jgi:signal transduction histidine kinase
MTVRNMGVVTASAAPEYRWLLPATLTADPPTGGGHPRRSTRDWVVDALCFLLALAFAVYALWDVHQPKPFLTPGGGGPGWLLAVDQVVSFAACAALWVRRRWPVGLALVTLPLSFFSIGSGIAVAIVMFTVVVHRRFAVAAIVAALNVGAAAVYARLYPDPSLSFWGAAAWGAVMIALVLAWGMFVRARRQLVVSWRDRAHRAEAEQRLRIEQARQLERTRIAREMHDVLAHRITLLSLHAGALEFRPDAPAEEIARAAGVIRTSAHQALQDLREVIWVLRAEDSDAAGDATDAAPERPQPMLADLPALVAESSRAGMRVTLRSRVTEPDTVPARVGRSAYRIVQEGLTNARKHAAGAVVTVAVDGGPDAGLTIEVRNRWPVGQLPGPEIPGAGTGLVGLAERTTLVGGRLEHGRLDSGDFRLRAWLPWPA